MSSIAEENEMHHLQELVRGFIEEEPGNGASPTAETASLHTAEAETASQTSASGRLFSPTSEPGEDRASSKSDKEASSSTSSQHPLVADSIPKHTAPGFEGRDPRQLDGETEPCFTVVDPLTRKIRIPIRIIIPTAGFRNKRTSVPSLCTLFLRGDCRRDVSCNQIHVESEAIEAIRAEIRAEKTCCQVHGDMNAAELEGIPDWSSKTIAVIEGGGDDDINKKIRQLDEAVLVDAKHLAFSAGLPRSMAGEVTPSGAIILQSSYVCRLQAGGMCRYGGACKFVHICPKVCQAKLQHWITPVQPQSYESAVQRRNRISNDVKGHSTEPREEKKKKKAGHTLGNHQPMPVPNVVLGAPPGVSAPQVPAPPAMGYAQPAPQVQYVGNITPYAVAAAPAPGPAVYAASPQQPFQQVIYQQGPPTAQTVIHHAGGAAPMMPPQAGYQTVQYVVPAPQPQIVYRY